MTKINAENQMKSKAGGFGRTLRRKSFLFLCVWLIAAFACMALADVDTLGISQILQDDREVTLYVNALEKNRTPSLQEPDAAQLQVSINDRQTLPVQEAERFRDLQEGVFYTFCIDISRSVTEEEMAQIREGIAGFISDRMTEQDYARILTIGSEITTICDTTQDKEALIAAAQTLDRTAYSTYLYKGLSEALEEYRKNVTGRPKRGAVIVFTDGMDDSDGAYSESEVNARSTEVRIPVCAVGLEGNDSSANLQSVGNIVRQSGGLLYSYADVSVADALTAIIDTVQEAWVLRVLPAEEDFGSSNLSWKVTYDNGSYSLPSTTYVYSLGMPAAGSAASDAEEEPAEEEIGTEAEMAAVNGALQAGMDFEEETEDVSFAPSEEAITEGAEGIQETEDMSEVPAVPAPDATAPVSTAEDTHASSIRTFIQDNMILLIAALLVLVALVILIIVLFSGRKKKTQDEEPPFYDTPSIYPGSVIPPAQNNWNEFAHSEDKTSWEYNGSFDSGDNGSFDSGENREPMAESAFEADERTVDERSQALFLDPDDERTVDGALDDPGIHLELTIRFEGQEETVTRYLIDELVLGRGADCDVDVVLGSGSEERKLTSRRHASIVSRQEGIYIRDENARNHTYVNGNMVNGEMPLSDGDMLQLGKSGVTVHILGF